MAASSVESRAVWVTVLIVVAIAVGVYLGWPRAMAYWDNTTLKQTVKANSVSCLDPSVGAEGCKTKMINQIREKTGIGLLSDDLVIDINEHTRKISVEVKYKYKLNYPLTGSMFGAKKDSFVMYRYRVITESKYTL